MICVISKLLDFLNHRNQDPLEKYKEEISETNRIIKYFEKKYKMSSDEFISKRYSRSCLDIEAADANNWATLYLTVGKMVK